MSKPTQQVLSVSEMFSSIQGEGARAGRPSIFLRLRGCDFQCSWCDTIEVWKQGTKKNFAKLREEFGQKGYERSLKDGALLVVTGGDPLLQQFPLIEFLTELVIGQVLDSSQIEIETQGSLLPQHGLTHGALSGVSFNVSPKLSNCGHTRTKRIVPNVLDFHVKHPYSWFKFPVRADSRMDLHEVESLIQEFNIPRKKVFLMPICSTQKEHAEAALGVASAAMELGVAFSPRLQLFVWNKTTGV